MKLLRYGEAGAEKPGMMDADGNIRDLSAHVADITGDMLDDASLAKLGAIDPSSLPKVDGNPRIGPCVANFSKFCCIGLNYADHAAEQGLDLPKHPILFMKANSAIVGPNDTVQLPRGSVRGDWELELGVVIGAELATDEVEFGRQLIGRPCLRPFAQQSRSDRGDAFLACRVGD